MNYTIIKKLMDPYEVYFLDITQEFVKRYGDCFAPVKKVTVFLGYEEDTLLAAKIYNALFSSEAHKEFEGDGSLFFNGRYAGGMKIAFENGEELCIDKCSLYNYIADKTKSIDMEKKGKTGIRKVLFTYGMTSDMMLILTDAPKDAIEKWARAYNKGLEDNNNIYLGDLKKYYYTKVIVDTELHDLDRDDIEIIDYDEVYELSDYLD